MDTRHERALRARRQPGTLRAVRMAAGMALLVGVTLTWAGGASAQEETNLKLGPGYERLMKIDPERIPEQLRAGIAMERRAIDQLAGFVTPESIAEAAKTIQAGYVMVRVAHHGIMRRVEKQKGRAGTGRVDSALLRQDQRVADARKEILAAHFQVHSAGPSQRDRLDKGIDLLNEAIMKLQTAMTLSR